MGQSLKFKDADETAEEKTKKVEIPSALIKKVARSISQNANTAHGNSIERANPALSLTVIQELARGLTIKKIQAKHDVDRTTVSRLLHRHRAVIDDIREYIAADAFMDLQVARGIMHKKFEQMDEDPEAIAKANMRDIVQSVALLNQGYQASVGENKVVIEHRTGPTMEEFAAKIAEAREKARARMLNVTPTTDAA